MMVLAIACVAGVCVYKQKPVVTHHGRGRIIDGNGNEREMTEEDWKNFALTEEQFRRLQDEIRRQRK